MNHNRKKSEKPSGEVIVAQRDKVKRCKELAAEVLQLRKERKFDDNTLKFTERVIAINPEFHTFWNMRREILRFMLDQIVCTDTKGARDEVEGSESGTETESTENIKYRKQRVLCDREMELTENALRRMHKSYMLWFHRLWVVTQSILYGCRTDLKTEFALCDQFLKIDERNYHCWGYRSRLLALYPFIDELKAGNVTPDEVLGKTGPVVNNKKREAAAGETSTNSSGTSLHTATNSSGTSLHTATNSSGTSLHTATNSSGTS
eukprot:Lankesteria_metandrocarpae@DN760_c0_g1_i1.p1